MGAAVLSALTGEHRAAGTVKRVRECNRAFREGVGETGFGSTLNGLGTLHVFPLFQILVLDEEALVDIAVDNNLAEGHRLFALRDSFQRKDASIVQHTTVVKSGIEPLGHIDCIGVLGKIHLGDFPRVCQFGIDWERLGEETFVRQPSAVFILAIGQVGSQVLVLRRGVFEGKDESAPSALPSRNRQH